MYIRLDEKGRAGVKSLELLTSCNDVIVFCVMFTPLVLGGLYLVPCGFSAIMSELKQINSSIEC